MRFWYQTSHPGAVAMGSGAILMSMEWGVTSSAGDPEQTVLLQVVWCLVVTFETIGVTCAFARDKR